MNAIFSAVMKYLSPQALMVVTGVSLLALGIVAMGYQMTLNHVEQELADTNTKLTTTTTNLATCMANEATLKAALERQNAAVVDLQKKCKAANDEADKRARAIIARPVKTAEGHGPEAINKWFNELPQ